MQSTSKGGESMADKIDVQALADEFEFDSEDVKKIISMFFKSTSKGLDALKKAITAADLDAIYKAAHSIKGSAGTLRLAELHAYALAVEEAGRNNVSLDYAAAYAKLAEMITNIEMSYLEGERIR